MDTEYDERTQLFSDYMKNGDLDNASFMLASLHEGRDYFSHNVDDDLAIVFFSQNGDLNSVISLMDLGVNPSVYDNAAIKGAVSDGYVDIALELAKDDSVDIIDALQYVKNEDDANMLKMQIIKRLSRNGDEESLKVLLDDPSFRIAGIENMLRPDHKSKYIKKMISELSRTFKGVVPPYVLKEIADNTYDLSGLNLYEIMTIIIPIMEKKQK